MEVSKIRLSKMTENCSLSYQNKILLERTLIIDYIIYEWKVFKNSMYLFSDFEKIHITCICFFLKKYNKRIVLKKIPL